MALKLMDIIESVNQPHQGQNNRQRHRCVICDYETNPSDESQFAVFPCNIRAFRDEVFKVWCCPECQTIHTLETVDLDHYYAKYPFSQANLTWFVRMLYRNTYKRFRKYGLSLKHSFLDYGCGVNGTFVQYLKQRGFTNCYGYDPYGAIDGFGNPTILQRGPFDYILLQDIIEHVEDPRDLLKTLNGLLSPGGYILIGTPNASNIDLNQPNRSNHYNAVHVPYHLHIYTRKSIEILGCQQGWQFKYFFDRGFDDTLWPGLNTSAWNVYQRLCDGSLDVLFEPIPLPKLLKSAEFLFNAFFGYYFSLKTDMGIMFYKPSTKKK